MITVPTAELLGILTDVHPLACPNDDIASLNCVRVEWDGETLHALAHDRQHMGISSWHPDDTQDGLFGTLGGADDPWAVVLPLKEVVALAKNFKLARKEGRTPLTVDLRRGLLEVARGPETGHSALIARVEGMLDIDFPDLRGLLTDADADTRVRGAALSSDHLAHFAAVRRCGPLELVFTRKLALVRIGERFSGAMSHTGERGIMDAA